jgi:hypothetical protein
VASTEWDKRLRAELAQELGFYPASLDPADIDRHRRLNAALDRALTLDNDPPEVCTPAGGRPPRIRRSPWPSRCGRPVRVSCDVNERWPSASVGVFLILRFPTLAIVVPCVTTFV